MASRNRNKIIIGLVVVCLLYFYSRSGKSANETFEGEENLNVHANVHTKQSRNILMDWTKVFKFVPSNIKTCVELFNSAEAVTTYSQYLRMRTSVEAKMYGKKYPELSHNEKVGLDTAKERDLTYYEIVKHPFVDTVCEIGHGNSGLSSLRWLLGNKHTKVYVFDTEDFLGMREATTHLKQQFSSRFQVQYGPHRTTLTKFKNNGHVCDIIIVDGRTQALAIENFGTVLDLKLANPDHNVLVFDGFRNYNAVHHTWENAIMKGNVQEIFKCGYNLGTKGTGESIRDGFAVGTVM